MSEAGMRMDFAGEDRERLAAMRKRQILIVEDEFVNREILKAYLEPEYEVLCAETGEEAREKIRAGFDIISLILLDLNLPDLHGMDILRWVREDAHFSKIPVIVMTSDKESEVESLTIGAVDFITKPYPMPKVIQARVRRIIELNETRDLIRETSRDSLTGLFNREYFFHYAEQYDHFHGEEPTDAVVMDVNHFRMINERYGKAFADEVLRRIGIAVKAFVKQNGGVACRREADRFLLYCPHRTDYTSLAEEVTAAAGGGMKGKIRIRLGVYSGVDKTVEMEQRFDRAKSAADTIRNSYNVMVALYDDELHDKEVYAERLLDEFQEAIDQKQFLVFFQPKFDIRPEMPLLCGAEALVRWKHPELGMISPGVFVPLFESNGLVRELDHYVWREAAAQIRAWKQNPGKAVPVSINVSRVDMMDPDLQDILRGLIEDNGLEYGDLHLEITESAYTQDAKQIIDTVNILRSMGFVIEMDDFGSGYSSLNMVTSLPIDVLKLDMGFIRSAFSEGGNTRMIGVIVDIAQALNVAMIAEGVETKEQMLALRELGCDIVQGYYFSRPVPADEFETFLKV